MRMIIGWQIPTHVRESLLTDAQEMARLHGHHTPGATVGGPNTRPVSLQSTSAGQELLPERAGLEFVGIALQQSFSLRR